MKNIIDRLEEYLKKDQIIARNWNEDGVSIDGDIELAVEEIKGIREAISLIEEYGYIDGAHHKQWLIDQVLRGLLRNDYDKWVADYCHGEEGPNTYDWDIGIAP